MSDVRNRSKAVTKSPEQQAQEIEQRRLAHEKARREHVAKLRQQHIENNGGKQKIDDNKLVEIEQQDKAYAKQMKQEDVNSQQLEDDVIKEMEQEQKDKKKKGMSLDL